MYHLILPKAILVAAMLSSASVALGAYQAPEAIGQQTCPVIGDITSSSPAGSSAASPGVCQPYLNGVAAALAAG